MMMNRDKTNCLKIQLSLQLVDFTEEGIEVREWVNSELYKNKVKFGWDNLR